MRHVCTLWALVFVLGAAVAGCGDDITDEEAVQEILDDFQPTMTKLISMGLEAKSTSSSGANITPVDGTGAEQGTVTIGGKVAQSSGENQNLDLWVQLDGDYSDTGLIFYATDNTSDETKLQFTLQIANQPADNTMNGSLVGPLSVTGSVEGSATFNLSFVTDLTDDDADPQVLCSRVTGTVSKGDASEDVDFLVPIDLSGLDQAQIDKCQGFVP
jgi:hypothetical protein